MVSARKILTRYDDYRDMLSDRVRMDAYEQAIRAAVKPGDVVLDLGAGLGILGFMALRAGAARVYAIEQGDAVALARRVARHTGCEDRMVFVERNSLEAELPELADVLVSETLGSLGVDENTLEFTIDARRRFLRPEAKMVPCGLQVWVAPIEHHPGRDNVDFWRDVRGVDYSPAIDDLLGRLSLIDLEPGHLLADPVCVADLDLRRVEEPSIEAEFQIRLHTAGTIHGLGGWFVADLGNGVTVRTTPGAPSTHWRQAFLPFREAVVASVGDELRLNLSITPREDHSDNTRVSYDYFCTQRSRHTRAPISPRAPCPCGSGRTFRRCCETSR